MPCWRKRLENELPTLGELLVVLGVLRLPEKLRLKLGALRLKLGEPPVILGALRVTLGELRLKLGVVRLNPLALRELGALRPMLGVLRLKLGALRLKDDDEREPPKLDPPPPPNDRPPLEDPPPPNDRPPPRGAASTTEQQRIAIAMPVRPAPMRLNMTQLLKENRAAFGPPSHPPSFFYAGSAWFVLPTHRYFLIISQRTPNAQRYCANVIAVRRSYRLARTGLRGDCVSRGSR